MTIFVDSELHIVDPPRELAKWIRDELIMDNPEYIRRVRMDVPVWGIPRELHEYKETRVEDILTITTPRGFAKNVQDKLYETMIPAAWIDERVTSPVEFKTHPMLRPYQVPAVGLARLYSQGCCIAPCGGGKTRMALATAADCGQSTLWITHTTDLLQQSMNAAIECLGLGGREIGLIQAETMRIGTHITFATVQTLSQRDITLLAPLFGTVIVDECHHVHKNGDASRMFADVAAQLPAFYRFGFTASEFRADGLIDTMFHTMGPKFYEVTQEELDNAGYVVHPEIIFFETTFRYEMPEQEPGEKHKTLNCQEMLVAMRQDTDRNDIVKAAIRECCQEPTLVLSDSLDHLKELMEWTVRMTSVPCAFVCGTTRKPVRESAIDGMRSGRVRMLFATYQLAKEGLDIPRLTRLVLATPKKDKTSVQQAAGRIMRPHEGKSKPAIYDIWDPKVSTLTHWTRERIRVYNSLGAEIMGGPKQRKAVAR